MSFSKGKLLRLTVKWPEGFKLRRFLNLICTLTYWNALSLIVILWYFFLSSFFLCSFSCCLTSKKFAWFPYLKQLFNIPFRFASSVRFECRLIREEKCISFAAGDNPLDSCNWNLCQLTPASLMPCLSSMLLLLHCWFAFLSYRLWVIQLYNLFKIFTFLSANDSYVNEY